MNRAARLQKRKEQKQAQRANTDRGAVGWLSSSTWILFGLLLALAGLGTLAVLEFTIWNKIPPALVGLWEIDGGPQKDTTFEFFRNGTLEVHLQEKKRDIAYKTQVHVRDRTLLETKKDPLTREEKTSESRIRELTADTLILETEKGDVLKMVRIE
jgi:hypothetical protein